MEESQKAERRGAKRLPLEFAVAYESMEGLHSDYVTNISRGGMFIPSREPLKKGASILIKIKVSGVAAPVEIPAEVIWVVEPGKGMGVSIPGMGVEFKLLSPVQRETIEKFIRDSERPGLGAGYR